MARRVLTDDEFVRIWETSVNRKDAADRCGVTVTAVSIRAQRLRSSGVGLKMFRRGRPKKAVMTEDLNALIGSIRAQSV